MNLLDELLNALHQNGKKFDRIRYIATDKGSIPIKEFAKTAYATEYNPFCGKTMINPSLIVAGDDWILERHIFTTGNVKIVEGWDYIEQSELFFAIPKIPEAAAPVRDIFTEDYFLWRQNHEV